MNILSIQSWVAYGHVGNAAAMFPMQRLGHDVWAVNTVQFSNHTGYGAWKGSVFTGDAVRDVVTGIEERGALPRCDGVLSGYMGDASIGEAILDAVAKVKAVRSDALYCCDPVIGDVGRGVFVRPGIPEFMKARAVASADIITPNHFELELLAGREARTQSDLAAALDAVHALGPKVIVVTSLHTTDTPEGVIDLVVSAAEGRFRVRTPLLPLAINGAGDAIAALFFVHYLQTRDAGEALARAASSVYGLLKRTVDAGSREILLIEAQDEFVTPTTRFKAERM
ncbi:pyridoxal kinase PdxY [Bradyrhizobium sp. LHD-71]|uniref:pyridoxal kinase PdxY n=1 Tax=Bradyrhizobium sp. LHD-71 TaxID=3072141 RepID=UPI00280E5B20|nr:pyridoxal kinase PdxY [Bradyrhizobium sp. LHD-71]MDQ8727870.1 pyridoxal kinase PdxY [Bradyrhizobium sp. LHD-71]